MILAVVAGILLLVALLCDQVTLSSGDYRGVLTWAISLCAAAFISSVIGFALTEHRSLRIVYVIMMLGATAITVDAVLRLLPVW